MYLLSAEDKMRDGGRETLTTLGSWSGWGGDTHTSGVLERLRPVKNSGTARRSMSETAARSNQAAVLGTTTWNTCCSSICRQEGEERRGEKEKEGEGEGAEGGLGGELRTGRREREGGGRLQCVRGEGHETTQARAGY